MSRCSLWNGSCKGGLEGSAHYRGNELEAEDRGLMRDPEPEDTATKTERKVCAVLSP